MMNYVQHPVGFVLMHGSPIRTCSYDELVEMRVPPKVTYIFTNRYKFYTAVVPSLKI